MSPPPDAVLPDSVPVPTPFDTRDVAIRVLLTPISRPPHGLILLLRCRPLRLLATLLNAFVCALLQVVPLRAVPPPCYVAAYL